MMQFRHKTFVAVAALCSGLAALADGDALRFREFKASPETTLLLPAIPADSTLKATNAFKDERLLEAVNKKAEMMRADWTTVSGDSAYMLQFPKSTHGAVLRTIATRMRPERFVKGKLRLKSNVISELKMNGKSLLTNSAPDSTANWKDAAISLSPEETGEIFITFISEEGDPSAPEIALEFLPENDFKDIAIAQGPDIKKRFLIENTALGTRVNSLEVSPDGRYLKVGYTSTYGQNKNRSWTELLECASGKTVNASLPRGARWMDKGSSLWYTVKTDDTYSLYSMDASTQRQTLMAENLPQDGFSLSPDASYIIYTKTVEGKKEEGPMIRVQNPDDRIPGYRDRYYLEKYDLKTGITQSLTYSGNSTSLQCISPDSKKLIYVSGVEKTDTYPFEFRDIIELDVNTLSTDTLAKEEISINYMVYSPDGKELFITAGPEAFGKIGKNNGGHQYSNDYDLQGYIMNIADRKVRAVTRDFNPTIEGIPQWNAADGLVYFRASDGFDLPVYSLNPKTGAIRQLPLDMPYIGRFSIGNEDAKWMAFTGGDYHYTARVELMDMKNGKIRLVADPYAQDFPDTEVNATTIWSMTASDGTEIECSVTLPPAFDESKKYPMIVYYYGGCTPSQKYVSVYDPQIFASRDYVAIVINPSGTYGYGQEFSARHANAWGDRTADDIIECVKAFCKAHPFVDEKKIGCLGASYGGFMTQYLQTKTDLFAAAVSHAGISNVTSYWGEGYWGYSYSTVAAPESYPWNKPELYTKQGSLFNADKIHTPLLLLHGNADTNVPIGESIQLFNALKILGRNVEFIQVDGENHYISNYDKRRIWQDTIMAWFAKYLQDAPQWWDSMYGK